MKLVIVGSVGRAWTRDEADVVRTFVWRLIQQNMAEDDTGEFVVGSGRSPAGGVDIWVEDVAIELGVPFMPFPPKARGWAHYKERDQAMADWCTKLIRIKSKRSTTYGSGWTRDRAKLQGKPTEEYVPNGG